ncbi:MAG TPA: hypothetical protein VL984_00690 [Acidimicrobiales bacterium]|nr:hypothetical protein [Acidimicrobiales bacterium]
MSAATGTVGDARRAVGSVVAVVTAASDVEVDVSVVDVLVSDVGLSDVEVTEGEVEVPALVVVELEVVVLRQPQ